MKKMDANDYTLLNSKAIDQWIADGWIWGQSIDHDTYLKALDGIWDVYLTPSRPVPHSWFGDLKGKQLLGLASGGGQQMPVFTALGAKCTVLDYSDSQLRSEEAVSKREGYSINIVKADMTKPLPFESESFDVIFHPVSNCYIKDVLPLWKECYRVLKKGGILLAGLDNGLNFAFREDETQLENVLPYDPLATPKLYKEGDAVEFSHNTAEQLDGQLRAGFSLTNIEGDTNNGGILASFNLECFYMTRAVK